LGYGVSVDDVAGGRLGYVDGDVVVLEYVVVDLVVGGVLPVNHDPAVAHEVHYVIVNLTIAGVVDVYALVPVRYVNVCNSYIGCVGYVDRDSRATAGKGSAASLSADAIEIVSSGSAASIAPCIVG